jgi:hypothetical protein
LEFNHNLSGEYIREGFVRSGGGIHFVIKNREKEEEREERKERVEKEKEMKEKINKE